MSSPKGSHEIAWNGISFLSPADWLPAELGGRYLILEKASEPILEMKWGPIKGHFSHKKHLRQLSRRHRKGAAESIQDSPLPEDWRQALASFQAKGFRWQAAQFRGIGATVYCPHCRNATLLQFYRSHAAFSSQAALLVLNSLQDHRNDGRTLWSVFDVRAQMPLSFKLWRHRFRAGSFELKFRSNTHTVVLNRWGPASVLLAGKGLIGFAESAAAIPCGAPHPVIQQTVPTVEWRPPRPAGPWSLLSSRLKLLPVLQQLRVWHLDHKNRILAVRVEGRRPLPHPIFDEICNGFSCV